MVNHQIKHLTITTHYHVVTKSSSTIKQFRRYLRSGYTYAATYMRYKYHPQTDVPSILNATI